MKQLKNNQINLDPYWITGFKDAEGSFLVSIIENKNLKLGWTINYRFNIGLHSRDIEILKRIQEYFKVGTIYKNGESSLSYEVKSLEDLINIIIPHFEKYGLITQKRIDFEIFKQIIYIRANNKILSKENLDEILKLKANLNKGFTEKLTESFPYIISESKPIFTNQIIPHPQWLTGFIDGESCFIINVQKSPKGNNCSIGLHFYITQDIRDIELMKVIINYLNCGYLVPKSTKSVIDLKVGKFEDNLLKIIPFLQEYPLQSIKQKDFQDWVKASILIKMKKHLTHEGKNEILKIKNGMNNKRILE